jgi:protoporphyrin/coproporphyrin ferrochelatase
MKTAIVLFNLGGPDSPQAIKPFLFNLFFDRAIINLPMIPRWLLARYISAKRAPIAQKIYAHLGGKSPLLEQTEQQADHLERLLGPSYKTFIAMRYWYPMTELAVQQIKEWGADSIILLPLYPHFSSASTGSSLSRWHSAAQKAGLKLPTRSIVSYPDQPGLINAICDLIAQECPRFNNPRIIFSAHGLPQSLIDKGDPYKDQIEQSVSLIVTQLEIKISDWSLCYQSRVGKQKWIGPSIDEELQRAADDHREVLIVPISFVSEHSETLVELDIEYEHVAKNLGIPAYGRVPTVQCHPEFLSGLIHLIESV